MSRPRRRHLLVVDDVAAILELYRDLLEHEGYRVSVASAPPTEPDDVARLASDLIILDLVFRAEELGLRFLERLELDGPTAAIPVVVVSAAARALKVAEDRFAPPVVAALAKPFDIDELLRIVGESARTNPGQTGRGAEPRPAQTAPQPTPSQPPPRAGASPRTRSA